MIPFSFNLSVSIDYFRATCIHHCRRIFFQNEFLWLIILPRFLFSIYQFSLVVILLPGIGEYFRSYSVVYQFWEWVIFGSGMFLKGLLWYYMPSICICIRFTTKMVYSRWFLNFLTWFFSTQLLITFVDTTSSSLTKSLKVYSSESVDIKNMKLDKCHYGSMFII